MRKFWQLFKKSHRPAPIWTPKYESRDKNTLQFGNQERKQPQERQFGPSNAFQREIERRFSAFSLSVEVTEVENPEFDMPAFSEPGAFYHVSLTQQTCTCADFQKRRRQAFPQNDISRWCKHLMVGFEDSNALKLLGPWHRAICLTGFGGPDSAMLVRMDTAPDVVLAFVKGSDWINVFAHKKKTGETIANASGPIEQFGWSISQKRWSYGLGPPGAGELRRYLSEITAVHIEQT